MKQSYETVDGWTAEAVVGLKRVLLSDEHTAIAVQAGALWVSEPGESGSEGGAEFRVLAGRSFGEEGQSFLNLEAAQRALSGGDVLGKSWKLPGVTMPARTGSAWRRCSSTAPMRVTKA